MFDVFWSGIFGGLFGPAIAQRLSRFKYWMIFLFATVAVHIASFIQDWLEFGMAIAISKATALLSKPVGILAPMGIGLLAVFVAFIGCLNNPSLNNPKNKTGSLNNSNKK